MSGAAAEKGDEPPMAVVIPLFTEERSCFSCEHARFPEVKGKYGIGISTYCSVYEQFVDSETYEAEDCFTFSRCEPGSQPELILEDS